MSGQELPARSYIDQPAFIHSDQDSRVQTGKRHSAFLKISEGCNRRCSFCIIPKLRGNVRSRTIESLVREATVLAQSGVRELNLVAQDLTEYGMEKKYSENLEMLLPQLCQVSGIDWIRLHYVYPERFSKKLIEVVADESKIVPYIDMPIQHTNDRILGLMNRRLRKRQLFSLIGDLREQIPGLTVRTSIIVGFPTETESEFRELCDDLVSLDMDYVGVFSYSQEEGTPAVKLTPQISASEKSRRKKVLEGILSEQALLRRKSTWGEMLGFWLKG